MLKGMAAALEQARRAAAQDEVPIGAVVMRGDEIVAEAHNETVAYALRHDRAVRAVRRRYRAGEGRESRVWRVR